MAGTDLFDVEAFKRRLALRLQRILAEGGQRLQKLANEQPKAPTKLRTVRPDEGEPRTAGRVNGDLWLLTSDADGVRIRLSGYIEGDEDASVTIQVSDREGAEAMSKMTLELLKRQGMLR